ncbi:winged helix-turn-helix domain-containing protein [Allokutzneria multivorans]|uniref:winged helix-turn-helix domain-containing protein n=1 Tax=Allokutzneria multivorans TaxID=1142134 RepID=UPI0031EB7A6A
MENRPVVLSTPEQFKALGHPLRHRMVITLRQRPATLAQLAAALGSTKGTVGYHAGVLQEAGLVRVAGTRRVRGGTEQYYEPVGSGLVVGPDAEPGAGTRVMISTALAELLPGEPSATRLRHLRITPERAAELADRLGEWAEQGTLPDEDDGLAYTLLLSLHRADIPALPPETPPPDSGEPDC